MLAVPAPTNRFFVNDYADVLSPAAEQAVYAGGAALYEKTGAQVVLVTERSTNGTALEEYTRELARQWGIGDSEKDTGVLLYLAVDDRAVRIEVGYGLEGAITDAKSGLLLDTYALPYFRNNEFETGLQKAYAALVNEVALEFGVSADPSYTPLDTLAQKPTRGDRLGMIVAVLLLIFLLSTPFGRRILLYSLLFRGGNTSGYRGGGGSFGGGGASRNF